MYLSGLTIEKFHTGLVNKEFSASEVIKKFFDYIADNDVELGAFLRLTKDLALSQASKVDADLKDGREIGILSGIPLAIKDNILVEGEPATAASRILENYRASYDASVIKKLKSTGAVFLGKTNLDEFAMGSSTENSGFKITKNPHDASLVPGGSSGGSAAAVASSMAMAALGSDTGGSIRQPAGFCGIVGLKPTYGAVSRFGLIAMASSLDQIGPLAKTTKDAAIIFKAISGRDECDSTSVSTNYGDEIINPQFNHLKHLVIGIPKEYFSGGLSGEVEKSIKETIDVLKSLGIQFCEISLPHTKYSLSVYYIIMPAEASANLARFDGIRYSRIFQAEKDDSKLWDIFFNQRSSGFGVETQRRIILGNFVLSSGYYDAYYAKAQKVRRLIKEDFDKAFDNVDVILTPVSPTLPFKIGEKVSDPLAMYLSDIFTIPVNLAGLPAISIPCFKSPNRFSGISQRGDVRLPVGFQLIGKPFREADILGIGQYYEKSLA